MKKLSKFLTVAAMAALAMPLAAHAEHTAVLPEYPGSVHAGYLGVGLHDVSEDRAAALKLKDARGVEVIALDHDGPAAKVGFREHDVILQMNGQDVASEEQLRRMLRETPAGRKANFLLSRDGQQVKIQVVLGDRAKVERASLADLPQLTAKLAQMSTMENPLPEGFGSFEIFDGADVPPGELVMFGNVSGAQVEALGPQLAKYFGAKDGVGVLVKEVRPDSVAAKGGLKAGDVIVRAAGQPVPSRVEWERLLRDNRGKAMPLDVLRDKHPQKLTLTIAARTQGELVPQSFELDLPDMAQLEAQVQAQVNPQAMAEAQKALADAQTQIAAHGADIEKSMAGLKKQMDSPEFKQQMQAAQAEAQAAVEQWKARQPQMQEEIDEQVKDAAEQARRAAEAVQQQFTPME